jgi:formamidopyrimidine-DNA glycosylase
VPELPEIESLRRRLTDHLAGRQLQGLEVLDAKEWRPRDGLSVGDGVGRTVQRSERRAKLLLLVLGDVTLLAHLKVSGQHVQEAADSIRLAGGYPYDLDGVALPAPVTRFVLRFAGGDTLYLNDRRRFAWLRLLGTADVPGFFAARRYGPDPLDPEFSPELLAARLAGRRGRSIKGALLEQTCLAGLGSIYADEALHRAGLHPAVRTGALTESQTAALYRGILDAVSDAIAVGGAVVIDGRALTDRPGESGGVDLLRVHGRAGLPCPTCLTAGLPAPGHPPPGALEPGTRFRAPSIEKTMVSGRTSYFCPVCQGAPDEPTAPHRRRRAAGPALGTSERLRP